MTSRDCGQWLRVVGRANSAPTGAKEKQIMAQLVLGIGMSHSTMVTLDDSLWGEWAAQDATLAILFDTEGQAVTYARLAERARGRYAQQATPRHWKEQYATVRQAVARLAAQGASARLDVVLVLRGDQLGLFFFSQNSALPIFFCGPVHHRD